jgi:diguanylate cyclase (GGDEF)-like protein
VVTSDADRRGRSRKPHALIWVVFGAYAVIGTLATTVLPESIAVWMRTVIDVSALVTIVVALVWRRPRNAKAWWLIAASVFFTVFANTLWTFIDAFVGPIDYVSPIDAIYFSSYPALALGLLLLVDRGSGRFRWEMALDAGIVTVGVASVAWIAVIDPFLDDRTLVGLDRLVEVAYPVLDLLVLGMALLLAFSGGIRSTAHRVLVVALAVMLGADTLYTVTAANGGDSYGTDLENAGWLLWSTLTATAALHPAMDRMVAIGEIATRRVSNLRILVFSVLALTGPAAFLVEHFDHGPGQQNWLEIAMPAAMAAALSVMLVARLGLLVGVAQRRATVLDAQAAELAMALREQSTLQMQLAHRALHDPLTGLANRALLGDRLEHALARRRDGMVHGLALLDLDGFKDVNDSLGHPTGDELLIAVSKRIASILRDGDTFARIGGDEFAILAEDVSADELHIIAQRVLYAIQQPYDLSGRRLVVTTSIGVLLIRSQMSAAEALRDADLALYAAKGEGKNQVSIFHPRLRAARLGRVQLAAGLRVAVAREELLLQYQPVVNLDTGAITAVEALVRWQPEPGRIIPPDEFIPIAEETGLIAPIGEWVLHQACRETQPWHDRYGIAVAVNVSGRQLRQPSFPDTVFAALRSSGLPARALVLEITETVLIATTLAEAELVKAHLTRLRSAGVRIAIDDFGTGYSSLSYLQHLPVDVLKIDRTFTHQAEEAADRYSERTWAFTRAVFDLGRSLRLETIAEGVETPGQARYVSSMKCRLAQGYLFARPMSPEDLERRLAAGASEFSSLAVG